MIRALLLTTGAALLGAYLSKSSRTPRGALPMADGPIGRRDTLGDPAHLGDSGDAADDGGRALAGQLQQARPAALEAGMPADRSNDADRVRPGFADYARGA